MTKDAEVDMKDVELNDVDPEKQPMTSGTDAGNGDSGSPVTEKNGIVKVKIPDEKETKFTGLSKEELLKVAGTPGWVKARWALLILFWLGWIGMLAGAIIIIVQAPRCKPLPEMNWWDEGALYQIGDVKSFAEDSRLTGLKAKIDDLGRLKVKGLVIGPVHVSSADKPKDLDMKMISPDVGTLGDLKQILVAAHKKSISVVLDLTPNYRGLLPWFSNSSVTNVSDEVMSATDYWLKEGVDGILLHGVDHVASEDSFWTTMRDTVNNHTMEDKKKALIGVTKTTSAAEVSRLLNRTGVDLLLSGVLRVESGVEIADAVEHLYAAKNCKLAWNIGDRVRGHLASLVESARVKLSQLLLLTLPGTAVFNYGDEIGLEDKGNAYPEMVWDTTSESAMNETGKEEMQNRNSIKSFFLTVNDLRVKERSLLHGEYLLLNNSTSSMAYLRKWDQSVRYIVALNLHTSDSVTMKLTEKELPETAIVVVSTDAEQLPPDTSVNLAELKVGPQQAVMLKFPYIA